MIPIETEDWPWRAHFPRLAYATSQFDAATFTALDFSAYGVDRPDALSQAATCRQAEYLAGRLCARQALALLSPTSAYSLAYTGAAPTWPAGFCGSISHTRDTAVAVAARQCHYVALGVDRERCFTVPQAAELADSILTPAEQARLGPCSAVAAQRICLSFSLKESLFKALHPLVQIYFDFLDAEIMAWPDSGPIVLRLLSDLSATWHQDKKITGHYYCADTSVTTLIAIPQGETL